MLQYSAIRPAIAISLGAIPGALSRYYITELAKGFFGQGFTYFGTFFINVTGCFIIALFYTLNERHFHDISPEIRLMVATGFCGAYTTFSTYGLETFMQLQKDNIAVGFIYWIGSAAMGMFGIQLGVILGRLFKIDK